MAAVLLACASWSAIAWSHPKPGAHADVRISIEDDAVRFHVVMNVLFADQLVNIPRPRREELGELESDAIRDGLTEYFGGSRNSPATMLVDRPNRVRIDGVEVAPVIREVRVVHPEPEMRPGFVQNPALLLPQIHVSAEYPCKTPPKTVSLVWGSYPRDFIAPNRDAAPISDVESVLTSQGRLDLVTFKKGEPEYVWHSPAGGAENRLAAVPAYAPADGVRLPLGTLLIGLCWVGWLGIGYRQGRLGLVAAATGTGLFAVLAVALIPVWGMRVRSANSGPPLSESQASEVFAPLHANVYRAFDYTRESDVYDALAHSVDGPMLDAIYNDIYRGLILQEEGGALCRVKSVTPLETQLLGTDSERSADPRRFDVKARWRVEGIVYHWGHSHARTNEYTAEFSVAARDGGWRIVGMRPIEQHRIESDVQAASSAGKADSAAAATAAAKGTTWRPAR